MTETLILRMPDVVRLTGISRSRIYVFMAREDDPFPKPIGSECRVAEGRSWLDPVGAANRGGRGVSEEQA